MVNSTFCSAARVLSDSRTNFRKFTIPAGTEIAGGSYLVLDESDFNPSQGTSENDFALDGTHGDDVWLLETDSEGRLTRFASF